MRPSEYILPDTPDYGVATVVAKRGLDEFVTSGTRKARGDRKATWERAKSWPERLTRPSTLAVPSVRREWLDDGLTLVGAVLGWLTPLLLKRIGSGPGGNFYEYGDAILCPLFACFGAGLGSMSGGLWRARHQGTRNGERKSPA
jgi:hypothetical protein